MIALSHAINTSFELVNAGDVDFYIGDSYYGDNIGGISLNVNPIPEPATMLLFGSGLIGLAGFRRKFKKS